MNISASIESQRDTHAIRIGTDGREHSLSIPPKPEGVGSSVNGGELLFLALATCYCNDLYREAGRLNIQVEGVVVEATADFPGIGLAATNIQYAVKVSSSASPEDVAALVRQTDAVAEVHNIIRAGVPVTLLKDHVKDRARPDL